MRLFVPDFRKTRNMRNVIMSALSLILIAHVSFAQQLEIDEAFAYYNSGFYCEGVSKCKTAYNKVKPKSKNGKKKKGELAFMAGECLRNTDRFGEAISWYDKAINLKYFEYNPEVYLRAGDMSLSLCDIDQAEKYFKEYAKLMPKDKVAQARLASIDYNKAAIANRSKHTVKPVVKVNSSNTDMAPTVGDKKGKIVVFSTSRPGTTGGASSTITCEPFMDIYSAELDKKGNFGPPEKIQGVEINTDDNEGSVCFDSRFKTMFFTRCPVVKRANMGCEIWMAETGSKGWEKPILIDLKGGNDTISVGHPCLTPDDEVLIFASDLPGGYGGIDLWYSVYNKRGKSWSSPKNMGADINTAGNEMFPTIGEDGALYFSSDGHIGMGGLDIFSAKRVGEELKWVKPANLGHPINSCANDFHFIRTDERNGYFSSNRPHTDVKGAYRDNIWSWELPPNLFTLDVRVYESGYKGATGPAVADAKIKIVASDGATWDGLTDDQGKVYYELKPDGTRYVNEETSYKIFVSKDGVGDQGYYGNDAEISTVGMDRSFDFIKEIKLMPKRPIRLPEVRYDLAKAVLQMNDTVNSKDSLNFVIEMLAEYPTLIISLVSHTDWRGSASSNKDLSQRRAQVCVDYLVKEKGVDPRRLRAAGAGREQPRTVYFYNNNYWVDKPSSKNVSFETIVLTNAFIDKYKSNKFLFERLHQFNRRTEGVVVSFDFDPTTAGEGTIEIIDATRGEEEVVPEGGN